MKHKYIVAMGVAILCMIFIVLCVLMATPVGAYDGSRITTARQDELHRIADGLRMSGVPEDDPALLALSAEWWAEEEALNILAKVVRFEADPQWCEWEHSVAVAVVVLNRVASPYFPGTVREVVAAPGQYLPAYTWGFENISRLSYEAAKAAMDGDHDVPADAYWQAQFPQGTSTWKTFLCDTGYFRSVTYICCGIPGVS